MKKKKIMISAALVATLAASLTSCNKAKPTNSSQANSDKLTNANFTYLSQDTEKNMRDESKYPDFAMAVKNFEKKYNAKMSFIYSPYSEKQGKLSAMMAAGNAPDFYQPIDGYPQFAINGYAQPVDNLINLKDSIWKGVKDAYDATEWKGKHNFIVTSRGPQDVVWYNKTLFENNGLENPYDLYKEGKWNWNTFRDAAIKLTQDTDGDKVIDQWGMSIGPESMVATTGNDFVKIDGKAGTITNNLKNPDVDNAFEFFRDAGAVKYNINQPDLNAYMTDFAKGKVAMYVGATWADTVWWKDLMKKHECSFVPAPKYPNSSDYYVGGSASIWMIPKGAKNPRAAAAFGEELRKASMDPSIEKKALDGDVKDRGWGDKELEMNKELQKLKYTYTFFSGVGNIGSDRWSMWYDLRVNGVPVKTEIEKHYNIWDNEIGVATGKIKLQHNQVAATQGTPKIDGNIDDAWKNAQEITTDQEKTTKDIATAKVKLLYDTDTLYVLAKVSDNKILNNNKNPYDCDSVEIFLDEDKLQGSGYDSNCIQLRVGADGKVSGGGAAWDNGKRAKYLTSAVKKVKGGYIVEAAYKFKAVKAKAGGAMGFNVLVNDEETKGKKKGTSVWNPDSGLSSSSPSRFGVVNFK